MPEDHTNDWWPDNAQDNLTQFPPITLSYVTGRVVSAQVYKPGGIQQASIVLVELQDTGEYAGWLDDSYTAGEYLFVFYDNAIKIASAVLYWDGTKEATALTLEAALDSIKGTGFDEDKHSLVKIKKETSLAVALATY